MTRIVHCPTCDKTIVWDKNNPYRPFCSQRCKLIDLGDWASEKHHIPGEEAKPNDDDDKQF